MLMGMDADNVVQAEAMLSIDIVKASISVWDHFTRAPAEGHQRRSLPPQHACQDSPIRLYVQTRLTFLSSVHICPKCPAFKALSSVMPNTFA